MTRNEKIAEISLIGHVKVPVIKKLHRKTFQFPDSNPVVRHRLDSYRWSEHVAHIGQKRTG
jgi:hypothetical protein